MRRHPALTVYLSFILLIVTCAVTWTHPGTPHHPSAKAAIAGSAASFDYEDRAWLRQRSSRSAGRGALPVTTKASKSKSQTSRSQGRRALGSASGAVRSSSVWYRLAVCESGEGGKPRWHYNGSSGFDGGLQFSPSTWRSYVQKWFPGYPAYAYLASPLQQIAVARKVLSRSGWKAWPACSRKLGLR